MIMNKTFLYYMYMLCGSISIITLTFLYNWVGAFFGVMIQISVYMSVFVLDHEVTERKEKKNVPIVPFSHRINNEDLETIKKIMLESGSKPKIESEPEPQPEPQKDSPTFVPVKKGPGRPRKIKKKRRTSIPKVKLDPIPLPDVKPEVESKSDTVQEFDPEKEELFKILKADMKRRSNDG